GVYAQRVDGQVDYDRRWERTTMRLFDQRGQVLGTSQGPDTVVPKIGEEVFLTNNNQRRRVLDVTYFVAENPGGIFTGMTVAVLLSDPVQAKSHGDKAT